MKRNIKAFIYPDEGGFVVEIPDVHAVTQGDTIQDAITNAKEAIALALDGEDLAEYDLAPDPSILVTIELGPLSHAVKATPAQRPGSRRHSRPFRLPVARPARQPRQAPPHHT